MLEITLGFPPSELSPNKRLHWAKLARAKKLYRKACWEMTIEQLGTAIEVPDGPLELQLLFIRPDRRSYDRDNLTARMKSGLDGMCDALKIDDKRFSTVVVRVAADEIGGMVKVLIKGEDNGSTKNL